ncbi:MAG: hypothetical protein FRX49_02023 [Trebouxia sp. A1-2]|nr:MAG: hypothetical protein FRX49_13043 [Trebouxia sp. A1-2]KAA6427359.1 MAG: hypothetical protein FRX49_02023 [Trebouxia sp. A1-2]
MRLITEAELDARSADGKHITATRQMQTARRPHRGWLQQGHKQGALQDVTEIGEALGDEKAAWFWLSEGGNVYKHLLKNWDNMAGQKVNSPEVTRFFWPPLIPLSSWSPTMRSSQEAMGTLKVMTASHRLPSAQRTGWPNGNANEGRSQGRKCSAQLKQLQDTV